MSRFVIISVVIPEACIFFWNHGCIADPAVVIPNDAKIFFDNETAAFINGATILFDNAPKKALYLILLGIYVLDSFISSDMFFSNVFLIFFFYLVANKNNSWDNLSSLSVLIIILNVAPACFLTSNFGLFSYNLTFTLLHSTIYISKNFFSFFLKSCMPVSWFLTFHKSQFSE